MFLYYYYYTCTCIIICTCMSNNIHIEIYWLCKYARFSLITERRLACLWSRYSNILWHITKTLNDFTFYSQFTECLTLPKSHVSSFADIAWLWVAKSSHSVQLQGCQYFQILSSLLNRAGNEAVKTWPPPPHSCSIMSLPDVSARLIGFPFLFMSHILLVVITATCLLFEGKYLYH